MNINGIPINMILSPFLADVFNSNKNKNINNLSIFSSQIQKQRLKRGNPKIYNPKVHYKAMVDSGKSLEDEYLKLDE